MKACTKCKVEKSKSCFHKDSKKKDGLFVWCKSCQNAGCRSYYLRKKEDVLKQKRQYRKDNAIEISASRAKYYLENKDLIRIKSEIYYVENKDRYILQARNRRARVARAEGTHTSADITNLLELQRHKCAYCKACIKDDYHVDHIVALVNGGGNGPDNLQILCPSCNLKKHAKCPIRFAQEMGFLL